MSSVSDEEAEAICEDMQAYAETKFNQGISLSTLCTLEAYSALEGFQGAGAIPTDAELQGACAAARDECIADPPPDLEDPFAPDPTACTGAMAPACEAEIGDYEACFNWQVDAIIDVVGQVPTCDELTLALVLEFYTNPEEVIVQPEPPAACDRLEAECGDAAPVPEPPLGPEEPDAGTDTGAGGAGG